MPALDERDREAITDADRAVASLQQAIDAAVQADALDAEALSRLRHTAEELVRRVNDHLPPHLDVEAQNEIRRRLVDLLTLGAQGGAPLDLVDRALIEAEAVRHVMRDLLEAQPPARLRDAATAIERLEQWLPSLSVEQVAGLAGVSVRQFQRLRSASSAPSSDRLQLVVTLVGIVRTSWTDRGVYAWFQRPRPELGGRAPIELLDQPEAERDLIVIARAGRVQGGS